MFEFTSSLFFWTIANFVVLLVVLNKFVLPSFYKMVEETQSKKQAAMDELARSRDDSVRILAEYQEKLAKVNDEAREILAEARREKEEIKKRELSRLLAEKQDILSGIKEELQNERRLFAEEMRSQAANLIIATSRKVLQKQLELADHEEIIRENIQDFETMLKS